MTNSNTTAKKLYKVFEQKYNPDTEDELKSSATKLNISIDEAAHRVDVFMDVNRKTLKGAYKVFVKAIEQAVADGALDKKVAEFAYFADDINDIDFAGKDYFIATDNLNNSFAFGIDDNGDNGYYFWFWTLTEAAEEIADITDAETAEVIPVERFWCEVEIAELSEQDAADIVAHFHGQDGANKFFKMRATELDGSEEDIDGDNVFDYLPALDELNDVDIGDAEDGDNNNDTQSAAEDFVEEYIFIDAAPVNHIVKVKCTCTIINGEELLTQAGTPRIVRSDKYGAEIQFMVNGDIAYYTFDDKNFDRQAEADFFAIMADRGACTIDDTTPPADEPATEEIAEILRDAAIDAAYQKACERVNVTIHKNGLLHWLAKPDNDDWTTNKSIADKILAECGLTDWQFVIKTQAEYFVVSEQATTISEICKMIVAERVPTRSQLQKMIDGVEKFSNEYWRLVKQYDNAPDDEPPANQSDEDDISDICKRTPEDDDKPCLLDWDDSAIGMDDSDKIFADPAAYAAAVEAAFKAQYPEGKAILKPAC